MQAARRQAIGRRGGWPGGLAHRRLNGRADSSPARAAGGVARSLRPAKARGSARVSGRGGVAMRRRGRRADPLPAWSAGGVARIRRSGWHGVGRAKPAR